VTVTLLDGNSDPVAGHVVTLAAVPGSGLTVGTASGPSDASGVVTFTVTAVSEDTYVLTATDTTQNQVITDTAEVLVDPAFVFSSQVVTLPSSAKWNAAGYNPAIDTFCIVTTGSSNKGAYSTDGGITWNATTLPASQDWGVPMANPLGTFTVCSTNFGGSAAYGGLGGGWTAGGALPGQVQETGLYLPLNTDPLNIAIRQTSAAAATYTSDDGGVTWDTRNSTPNVSNSWLSVAGYGTSASATSCMVVAAAGNQSSNFNDAATVSWSSAVSLGSGTFKVASNGTGSVRPEPRFFAVTGSTTGATSNDGVTWNAVTLPANLAWFQPVWCKNRWVLLAAGDKAYTSATAGTGTWTEHTLPASLSAGSGSGNQTIWPANVNGDAYYTVVPIYNTNQAILIKTTA